MQRPISPHLQIYRRQVTSVMSILHRLSGLSSTVALVLISLLFIAAPYGAHYFESVAGVIWSWPGRILLALAVLAFFYHLCNGIRHLVWDTGRGLEIDVIRKSAAVVLVAAAILTLVAILV